MTPLMPVSMAGLSCPGWVNCRCLMMRPFGCRTAPAWNGPFLQFLPYLATSSADSLVSFTQRSLSAMALPAACAPLLADEMVCTALALNALESKPSSLSQRSMVPASPRKTMSCSSWMMVTLCVPSGLLFPVLASASPSPPSNGMSSLESSSIMVFPSNPLGSSIRSADASVRLGVAGDRYKNGGEVVSLRSGHRPSQGTGRSR